MMVGMPPVCETSAALPSARDDHLAGRAARQDTKMTTLPDLWEAPGAMVMPPAPRP